MKLSEKEYFKKYSRLITIERESEISRHQEEIAHISGAEREKKGRTLTHMWGKKKGKLFGNYFLVRYSKQNGNPLPETEIHVGDGVVISTRNPLDENNPKGTVYQKRERYIDVAYGAGTYKNVTGKKIRIDLYANEITYQRMQEALTALYGEGDFLEMHRNILTGAQKPGFYDLDVDFFFDKHLNPSQKEAVRHGLKAQQLALIQGPPGTGKTVTGVEIIRQAVKRGQKVLATADSNGAVDHLLSKLAAHSKRILRIGNPLRINDALKVYSLDFQMEMHPMNREKTALYQEIEALLKKQEALPKPKSKDIRGLTGEEILALAESQESVRGIPVSSILEMAPWFQLQHKINPRFEKLAEIEAQIIEDLIKKADIICATNTAAGGEVLYGKNFDLLVMDEATQATEPSCLIPLVKAKRAVLIGDEKQLPPTVLSEKAAQEGLSLSLFERMLDLHGPHMKKMLTVQYRMHEKIMGFSAKLFYEQKIRADASVARETLHLPGFSEEPIQFWDLRAPSSGEKIAHGATSFYNEEEAHYVSYLVGEMLRSGILPNQIGIITPYKAQSKRIEKYLSDFCVETNTVDGYQGREKDIIILSLVRSNPQEVIGFLKDERRLNVSVTRAKRRLFIIGDGSTLSSDRRYQQLISYVQAQGLYRQIHIGGKGKEGFHA